MNKDMKLELDENELEAVSGGATNSAYLDEERVPKHWRVTCSSCRKVFTVGDNKACPYCGNPDVELTY